MGRKPNTALRTGWTTGACATGAARAAYEALVTGAFPDPVTIALPRGQTPSFALADRALGDGWARAGIVKDAGDDPDVTHGALVHVVARPAAAGAGVVFRAGEGVGRVTRPGLPIPPGEPAINPAPRAMILDELARSAAALGRSSPDLEVEIGVVGGSELALKTWNPRLGIEGGLSILGTTGVVKPYSCAAWIASIHRGIDVARANGAGHALAATGSTSEAALKRLHHDVPLWAMLDMGDFAGGLLKYLADRPIPKLTIGGGVAKMTKLAQGARDLHSARSQVDFARLAAAASEAGLDPEPIASAETAMAAFEIGGPALAARIAEDARRAAVALLGSAPVAVETVLVNRAGEIVGRAAP